MSEAAESVVLRRNVANDGGGECSNDTSDAQNDNDFQGDSNSKLCRLTLMEEILLLGLKDNDGYTSFWNDNISLGLRACFLIELALRGRISLEKAKGRYLQDRNVVIVNDRSTGDMLLDEALRTIVSNSTTNVKNWIEYLSGESFF